MTVFYTAQDVVLWNSGKRGGEGLALAQWRALVSSNGIKYCLVVRTQRAFFPFKNNLGLPRIMAHEVSLVLFYPFARLH